MSGPDIAKLAAETRWPPHDLAGAWERWKAQGLGREAFEDLAVRAGASGMLGSLRLIVEALVGMVGAVAPAHERMPEFAPPSWQDVAVLGLVREAWATYQASPGVGIDRDQARFELAVALERILGGVR